MKATFSLLFVSLLLIGVASFAQEQAPAVTHNTWTTGTVMPDARMGAAAGAVGPNVHVIGGFNNSDFSGVNQIYNIKKNSWTTGTSDPNPRAFVAYAVVDKILYIFGGSNGSEVLSLTESYNPATDTWTTLAPMPSALQEASAVADKGVIYVIGGEDSSGTYHTTVESYDIATNTWTAEAPLLEARGQAAVGLLGTTVVAADGQGNSSVLGDNEGYTAKKNAWAELTADPTPRTPACFGAIMGVLYVAGGQNGSLLTLNESYNAKTKSWTTLASMPDGVWFGAASAVSGNRLYCFGGGQYEQGVDNYVQIYQP